VQLDTAVCTAETLLRGAMVLIPERHIR